MTGLNGLRTLSLNGAVVPMTALAINCCFGVGGMQRILDSSEIEEELEEDAVDFLHSLDQALESLV